MTLILDFRPIFFCGVKICEDIAYNLKGNCCLRRELTNAFLVFPRQPKHQPINFALLWRLVYGFDYRFHPHWHVGVRLIMADEPTETLSTSVPPRLQKAVYDRLRSNL